MAWYNVRFISWLWNGGTPAEMQQPLTNSELRASGVPTVDSAVFSALSNRYGGGKSAATVTLTDAAEVDIVTPAAGNAVRAFWVSAINRDPATSFPAITIKIGTTVIYLSSAISHWEIFEGAAGEKLTGQLSVAGTVDVTVHYQEFTP